MLNCYIEPSIRYGELFYSFANSFRNIAFEIDANPDAIFKYHDLPAVNYILSDQDSTALLRTRYLEAFSYGDPGVLLSCPGPSLSGLMLRELGLPEQVDDFYRILKKDKMRTFFALTEPKKGSDASQIETYLTKQNVLTGVKSFFGNGAVGKMGIIFARMSNSPVGIRAIWLTPSMMNDLSIEKITLPQFALRGAQIAIMRFNETVIPESQILGQHLSACENGLLGIMKVFNRLRTGVGALAIGQAQAVYDLTYFLNQKKWVSLRSLFSDLTVQLESARHLLRDAAKTVDKDPYSTEVVSLAKVNATQISEKIIERCIDLCSMDNLLENPWLIKAYRDMFCWEYMEGTSAIQKKQIAKKFH